MNIKEKIEQIDAFADREDIEVHVIRLSRERMIDLMLEFKDSISRFKDDIYFIGQNNLIKIEPKNA